jgi:hypothetical protein
MEEEKGDDDEEEDIAEEEMKRRDACFVFSPSFFPLGLQEICKTSIKADSLRTNIMTGELQNMKQKLQ